MGPPVPPATGPPVGRPAGHRPVCRGSLRRIRISFVKKRWTLASPAGTCRVKIRWSTGRWVWCVVGTFVDPELAPRSGCHESAPPSASMLFRSHRESATGTPGGQDLRTAQAGRGWDAEPAAGALIAAGLA